MIKLTQKTFNKFLDNQKIFAEALNHRITKIEVDVKWIKKIGYISIYMAFAITLGVGKFLLEI